MKLKEVLLGTVGAFGILVMGTIGFGLIVVGTLYAMKEVYDVLLVIYGG